MTTFRESATTLWGAGGAYIHECYQKHLPLFPDMPQELPMVIGLSAYGSCLGLTRANDPALDHMRISIASQYFKEGTNSVSDTVLHEMMHCYLHMRGMNTNHDSDDWYNLCMQLAPKVLGHPISLQRKRRVSVRVPNPLWTPDSPKDVPKTVVRKKKVEGLEWEHNQVARFPHPFRPSDWEPGYVIDVPTY